MSRTFVLLVCLALLPLPLARGWGGKEHVQQTRIAIQRLVDDPTTPPAMREWLKSLVPKPMTLAEEREFLLHERVGTDIHRTGGGVLLWCILPDTRASNDSKQVKVRPFNQSERLMHYIDLELFLTGDAPRTYRDDLSGKPRWENIPRNWKDDRYVQAGYLPFATELAYEELVRCLREGKWVPAVAKRNPGATPVTPEEASAEDSAMKWAGYLAHYLQDNTQPHHSTLDYQSASYFPNARRAPRVHQEMEWRLVDDERELFSELRAEYWAMFERALDEVNDPAKSTDVWESTLQVSMDAYDALPLIGAAAVAARVAGEGSDPDRLDTERFMRFRGRVRDRELTVVQLKAEQCALAVHRTARVYRQAWLEAQKRGFLTPLPPAGATTAPLP